VLDATPADKCTVPACPAPKKPTIVAAAKNAVCKIDGIAMIINGNSARGWYHDSMWSDSKTGDLGDGCSKTDLFFAKAKIATFKFQTGNQVRTISANIPGGKSLQEVFQGSFHSTTFETKTWHGLGGSKKFAYQRNCNRQGWNVQVGGKSARFGIIMNNENNCGTPDTEIGVGFRKPLSVSAGGYCGGWNSGGKCQKTASTVTISVKD